MSNVTLYSAMPSRGMMPHWALEESGIEYNLQLLDLDAEENKQPDYLALNPLGKVPTLVHGDTVVTESAAIVAYVAETFADGGLAIAPGSPERGAYLRWLHFAAGSAEGRGHLEHARRRHAAVRISALCGDRRRGSHLEAGADGT